MMKRSPWCYLLSQGTCNGCELECLAAFTSRYDAERAGAKLVSSPRHADIVLATGCGTRKAVQKTFRTLDQVPEPKAMIQIGACALNGGIFKCEGPRVGGDIKLEGCPPRPSEIIQAIKKGAELCSSKR